MNLARRRRGWAAGIWLSMLCLATTATAEQGATSSDDAYQLADLRRQLLILTRPPILLDRVEALSARIGKPIDVSQVRSLFFKNSGARSAADKAQTASELQAAMEALADEIVERLPTLFAADVPNDDGGALFVFWKQPQPAALVRIERKEVSDRAHAGTWTTVETFEHLDAGPFSHNDKSFIRPGRQYAYRVSYGDSADSLTVLSESSPTVARGNWFHGGRIALFMSVVVLSGGVLLFINLARSGVSLNIRRIAGLEAVDEAVGRATEMGRPIIFIPGIQDMNDIQTVAGITILGRVARTAAERDAQLEVPTGRSLVMTAARETVQASCMDVGRPDAYDEKRIYYTTDEQFGYVAAVTGVMVRERPATCFYMGAFFAESLILAETANLCGAIQIAGTAQPAQLPFFVAACDYTLIGEEFFAASAYLSGEPAQLGSLKGQDIGKLFGLLLILSGALVSTFYMLTNAETAYSWLDFLTYTLLDTADN